MTKQQVFGGIFGLCVGDALGVPVEFRSRAYLASEPIHDMIGFGTHNQPPGTWSDDSSLAFCTAESLCYGFNTRDAGDRIVRFERDGHWTPYGKVFDVGNITKAAIDRLSDPAVAPEDAGARAETDNGNGSLIRILPLGLTLGGLPFADRWDRVSRMSSLTHGHPRAILASMIYAELVLELLGGRSPSTGYDRMRQTILAELGDEPELVHFQRILGGEIAELELGKLNSGGYVVHTLEAALWSFLSTSTFPECVLRAVNLGGDSDTTGAVAGGLAGVAYGFKSIPPKWVDILPRKMEIGELADKLCAAITGSGTPTAPRDVVGSNVPQP